MTLSPESCFGPGSHCPGPKIKKSELAPETSGGSSRRTRLSDSSISPPAALRLISLFARRPGRPLIPVEERPFPQSDVPGEQTYPTQPFQNIPSLAPLVMSMGDSSSYQRSPADIELCRKQLADLRYEGIYTPSSLKGSLNYPGPTGGVNWGGAAIDPNTGILYANTNRIASVIRLVPRRTAKYEMIEENIDRLWLRPYLPTPKFWAEVFVIAFLLASAQRRRLNPGWAPAIVLIVGAGFIGGYPLHASQARPAPMNWIDHFGNELSPQRKS